MIPFKPIAESSQFRPIAKDSLPPEGTQVLVRFKHPEATKHVCLAVTVYQCAPYKSTERMFVGFLLLLPPGVEYGEGRLLYTWEDVDVFDGWMPCPE